MGRAGSGNSGGRGIALAWDGSCGLALLPSSVRSTRVSGAGALITPLRTGAAWAGAACGLPPVDSDQTSTTIAVSVAMMVSRAR